MNANRDEQSDTQARSDYDAVGGGQAVAAVVDRFYVLILDDDRLRGYFDGVEMDRLKRHQTALVSQVMGGPVEYSGRQLRTVHQGKGITTDAFTAVAGHLVTALTEAGVEPAIIDRTVTAVAGTAPDIIENDTAAG